MHALLMVLGIALVIFGAVVLIRYSDRPGGTLKLLGMEVTSKGAGLPLIALGIACIALVVTRPATTEPEPDPPIVDLPTGTPACLASFLESVPAERIVTVEAGMRDMSIVSPPEPLDTPVALVLTDGGATVGAVRIRLVRGTDASSHLFKVEEAVGADCQPARLSNASRPGDPRNLPNWDVLRLRLGAADYDLRLGAEEQLRVGYFTRAS